jgi:type 1 glutamine amidotransferase
MLKRLAARMSRRDLLQSLGVVAAAEGLGVSAASAASRPTSGRSRSSNPPRTLALIGDRYHNPDYIRVSLNRLFKELGLPIDYTMNYYDLSRSLLEPYQLFICLRDNMIWPDGYPADAANGRAGSGNSAMKPAEASFDTWITEDQGAAVRDFVAAGNGFYSLHNNAFVSRSSKNFRDVQGGLALSHPPLRPFKVRIVNKEHPVTRGVEDFMVTDEQHFLIYDKDPKNILLRGENIDGLSYTPAANDLAGSGIEPSTNLGTISISGWAHEHGKGRVVFTAVGHTIDAMWQPEHLKMQRNAVRWLLRMS